MAKEAKKIRITKGEYWSEGMEGLVLMTYGDEKWGDEIHYLVDPPGCQEGVRFVRDCCCEVVAEPTDIPHGATTAPFEEDFPEYADHIAEDSTPNMVDSPPHYQNARFETIEVIEEITAGYSDGFVAYNVGNALKYLARAPYKHDDGGLEDCKKAAKYLEFAIKRISEIGNR
ncbi:DUF3310 domain-containing protein [Rossellomorea sp. FS2]|uniref:DUF3310 domain-containing protein n=1 Tax=Rossellomorea sp. FS2 TaxID=3391447 RepID=UPI003A4E1442